MVHILRTSSNDDKSRCILRMKSLLTLKAPITTAADEIHTIFSLFFSEKIRLDVSSESPARQRIHMQNQALFSSKDKSKKLKCRPAAIFVWRFKD